MLLVGQKIALPFDFYPTSNIACQKGKPPLDSPATNLVMTSDKQNYFLLRFPDFLRSPLATKKATLPNRLRLLFCTVLCTLPSKVQSTVQYKKYFTLYLTRI